MSQAEHFARLAESYDELRPVESTSPLYQAIVREGDLRGRSVLDVGCGTGRFVAALAERYRARPAGVDPSAAMLEVARRTVPAGLELVLGTAEELPFADDSFEAVTMVLVVHHVDRARAFPEVRRVLAPRGRFVIATRSHDLLAHDWVSPLLPSYAEIAQARYPHPERLLDELAEAGFSRCRTARLDQRRRFSKAEAVAKLRGRYSSFLDLLPPGELEAGIERAERELPDVVEYTLDWAVVTAKR